MMMLKRRWLAFALAALLAAAVHEGVHAALAVAYGEYGTLRVHPFGLEVIYRTPLDEREGAHWALIAGGSSLFTISLGYLLLALGDGIARLQSAFLRIWAFYATLTLLLLDAFNLSIGPFLYGGDAGGIAAGLGISRYTVQAVFLVLLLLNRELVAQRLLPMYGVQTRNVLFRPFLSVLAQKFERSK